MLSQRLAPRLRSLGRRGGVTSSTFYEPSSSSLSLRVQSPRFDRPFSLLASHLPCNKDDNRENQQHQRLLYSSTLPRIALVSQQPSSRQHQRRTFASTSPDSTTTTTERNKNVLTDHLTEKRLGAEELDKTTIRWQDSMHERAVSMKKKAQGRYRDFREDPRQSARSMAGMVRQYGPVFIGTYLSVYFCTLGVLFLGVESGVLDPVNLFSMLGHAQDGGGETKNTVDFVIEFMESHTLTKPYTKFLEKNPQFANLAVAWVAVKFTEPIRLAASIGITPRVARYFGYSAKVEEEHDDGEKAEEELKK